MSTITEQIQELATLLGRGEITQEEFQARRDALMAGSPDGAAAPAPAASAPPPAPGPASPGGPTPPPGAAQPWTPEAPAAAPRAPAPPKSGGSPILPALVGAAAGGFVVLVLMLGVMLVTGSLGRSEEGPAADRDRDEERDEEPGGKVVKKPERGDFSAKVPRDSLGVVNGTAISGEDFDRVAKRMKPREGEVDDAFKRKVMDELVAQTLLYHEARRRAIDEDPKIRKMMVNTLLKREVYGSVDVDSISEAELKAYFEAHSEDFVVPEKVQIKRILIQITDDRPREEALAEAERLKGKVESKPSRIKSLAQEHSEGPYRRRGGDLGFVAREGKPGVDQEVVDAAFDLRKGEVGMVETADGFSVLYIANRREEVSRSFDQMRGSVLRKVKSERYGELYDSYVDNLTRDAVVGIDEAALDAHEYTATEGSESGAEPESGETGEAEGDLLRMLSPG